MYEEVLKLRKDSDYVVNQPQMDKFVKVLDFFLKHTASDPDADVEPVDLTPSEMHGGVTATFLVFDIYGDLVTEFCDTIRNCAAITIDAMTDGRVCISCTVPDVFVPIGMSNNN